MVLAAAELPSDLVADINTVFGWIAGLVGVVCMAKIIFVGARLAWDHKHNPGVESPASAEFLAATIGWIIATAIAVPTAILLISAGQGPQSVGGSTPPRLVGCGEDGANLTQQIECSTKSVTEKKDDK